LGKHPTLETLQEKLSQGDSVLHLIKGYDSGIDKYGQWNVIWVVNDKGLFVFKRSILKIISKSLFQFIPFTQIDAIEIKKETLPMIDKLASEKFKDSRTCTITVAFGSNVSRISHIDLRTADLLCQTVNKFLSQSLASLSNKDVETTKSCPDCAEDVKTEAKKCRFCGFIFI